MSRALTSGACLVVATHNPGKLREIATLLAPFGIDARSAGELGLPEPEEDAADFVGNARIKARAASRASQLPALADDSGFCVAGLGGSPGVLSARWAGKEKDFTAAMARVQRELGDGADRRAWFISVLTLAWPDGHVDSFMGRVDGAAIWPPRGDLGFGYDPMFIPRGETRTYGEMSPQEKDKNSHRAHAFQQFRSASLRR